MLYICLQACAPRYIWFSVSQPKYPEDNRWSKESTVGSRREPVGTCWIVGNNFNEPQEFSPCRTSKSLFSMYFKFRLKFRLSQIIKKRMFPKYSLGYYRTFNSFVPFKFSFNFIYLKRKKEKKNLKKYRSLLLYILLDPSSINSCKHHHKSSLSLLFPLCVFLQGVAKHFVFWSGKSFVL